LFIHRGITLICVLYPSHVSHQNIKLIHAQCFLPWAGCVWCFHGCHMLYAFYPCCMIKVSLMWNIKKFLRQWCKWYDVNYIFSIKQWCKIYDIIDVNDVVTVMYTSPSID
jgi:hypothetical protein